MQNLTNGQLKKDQIMNIQQELDLLIKNFNLNASSEQLLKPQIYANWLAQTYYYVVHSTSLLGYSLPYLKNVELKRHFENHLGEESRHDLLVLKDLDRLGFKLD